jgi:hypothetical protein
MHTVFEEVGHITRSVAMPLAAMPLGPEAQERAVIPVSVLRGGLRVGWPGGAGTGPGPVKVESIGGHDVPSHTQPTGIDPTPQHRM